MLLESDQPVEEAEIHTGEEAVLDEGKDAQTDEEEEAEFDEGEEAVFDAALGTLASSSDSASGSDAVLRSQGISVWSFTLSARCIRGPLVKWLHNGTSVLGQ